MSAVAKGPAPVRGPAIPDARVSLPDFVDWHMILDEELTRLGYPESGFFGAVGFTFFGAALGLLPSASVMLDKAPKDMTHSDLVAGFSEVGTMTAGVICLVVFGIASWRNRSLVSTIRARQRRTVDNSGSVATP